MLLSIVQCSVSGVLRIVKLKTSPVFGNAGALTLALTCVTSRGDQVGCPAIDAAIKTFADLAETVISEIPSTAKLEEDLSRASADIQSVVTSKVIKDSIVGQKPSASESSIDSLAIPFIRACCPKPTYDCTSVWIQLKYIKWWRSSCLIITSWPLKPAYIRCTCVTCVIKDYCPRIGRCVETDYRFVIIIVYCPVYHRFFKILIRIPTRCECLSGCSPIFTKTSAVDQEPRPGVAETRPGDVETNEEAFRLGELNIQGVEPTKDDLKIQGTKKTMEEVNTEMEENEQSKPAKKKKSKKTKQAKKKNSEKKKAPKQKTN